MAMELAKAYVQIVPSAQGIQGSIENALNGEADSAGEKAGKSMASRLAGAATKALAGLGIGKAIYDSIDATAGFESAMAKTATLFTGTETEFANLQSKILEVSSATGMGAETLAAAAYSAESASVPMEMLGSMIESSAKLAIAGFTDVDTALSATAKTMNAYGMTGTEAMEKVQAVLIQTQNKGITSVGELGASLANVTPTAAAMGVSFEQVGAAMAQMTAQGVPTAQATTQLRSAMSELGKVGTQADKSFRKAAKGTQYAGMSFKEAIASGANLGDVFGIMQTYADKSGKSMVDLWGSVEAGNAAMMIAGDLETFNADLEAMYDTAGLVEEGYQTMADTFSQSMNSLKESAKNFGIALFSGMDMGPAIDNLVASLGDVSGKLLDWLTTGLKNVAANLPNLVSGLFDLGETILNSLGNIDWLQLGVDIVNGVINGLGELGTRLIGVFTNGISAIGEINWSEIGQKILDGVTSIITNAGDWLKKLFGNGLEAVKGLNFGEIGGKILAGVTGLIDSAGAWLSDLFSTALSAVTGLNFGEIGTTILSGVTGVIDTAGAFLSSLFSTGETEAEGVGYSGIGSKILEGVTGSIDAAGNFLKNLFEKGKTESEGLSWSTVGTAIETGVNLVLKGGQFLASAFEAGAELIGAIDWSAVGEKVSSLLGTALEGAASTLEAAFEGAETLIRNIDWSALAGEISDLLSAGLEGAAGTLEAAFDGAETFISSIDWSGLAGDVSNLLSAGLEGAASALEAAFDGAETFISNIDWSALAGDVSDLLSAGLEGAAAALEAAFDAAATFISGIEWSKLAGDVSGLLSTGLEGAASTLEAGFTAAHDFILGINWSDVGASIQSGLGDVWSGLTGLIGGVLGGVGDAVSGIGSGIGEAASGVGQWINTLINGDQTLATQVADLKKNMDELAEAVKAGKTEAETAAKEISQAIRDGLAQDLTADAIGQIGSDAMNSLVAEVQGGGESAASAAEAAGKSIKDGIGKDVTEANLQEIGTKALEGMTNAFTSYDFEGAGTDAAARIASGVEGQAGTLQDAAEVITQSASDVINDFQWDTVGQNLVTKLAGGVSANSEFADAMMAACDEGMSIMASGWDSVGRDIVGGIISGVSAYSGTLYGHLRALALNALKAAKNALGISSPSKVMRDEIGQWIPAGIATGIENNSRLVEDAMSQLKENLTAEDMSGAVAAQDRNLMGMQPAEERSAGLLDSLETMIPGILNAVRQGMEEARIPVYLDGRLVSNEVNRQMGSSIMARRFATT